MYGELLARLIAAAARPVEEVPRAGPRQHALGRRDRRRRARRGSCSARAAPSARRTWRCSGTPGCSRSAASSWRCAPKNDPAIAEAAFREHPEMVLRRADYRRFRRQLERQGGEPAARSREQLNIGLDSLVFVDDNPVERARVREACRWSRCRSCPTTRRTTCAALPRPATSRPSASPPRTARAPANTRRTRSATSLRERPRGGMDEFLRALDMTVEFGPVHAGRTWRASTQLINKTNQFNTTTAAAPRTRWRRSPPTRGPRAAVPAARQLRRQRVRQRDDARAPARGRRRARDRQLGDELPGVRPPARGRSDERRSSRRRAHAGRATLRADFVPTARNGVIAELFPRLGFRARTRDGREPWSLRARRDYARAPDLHHPQGAPRDRPGDSSRR